MRYKMIKRGERDLSLEKYTEPKGFFRNTTGPLKVGEIRLYNSTENGWFEDFLTEEDGTYYMILGCADKFGLIYRDGVPRISIGASIAIGDKKNNIPIEDRIKFLYEGLSSNIKYECLGIIYKNPNIFGSDNTLFRIDFDGNDDGIATFNISD